VNYRVVWPRRLENALGDAAFYAYERGHDAVALRRAAADIELALSDNPAELGESRVGAERVLIIDPLAVIYEVFEAAQVVCIYEAVHYPRRRL
jgi:hypothetical protein